MSGQWLDRGWILGPYLRLVLDEAEYYAQLKLLGIKNGEQFPFVGTAQARLNYYKHAGKTIAFVCCNMTKLKDYDGIQVAALLVHEASHVFDFWCKDVGERRPSAELKAYSLQAISQALMYSWADQNNGK